MAEWGAAGLVRKPASGPRRRGRTGDVDLIAAGRQSNRPAALSWHPQSTLQRSLTRGREVPDPGGTPEGPIPPASFSRFPA
jgi:hypothetical protein